MGAQCPWLPELQQAQQFPKIKGQKAISSVQRCWRRAPSKSLNSNASSQTQYFLQPIFEIYNSSQLESPNQAKSAYLPNFLHSLTETQLGHASPQLQPLFQANPISLSPNPPQNPEKPSKLFIFLQLGPNQSWVPTRPCCPLSNHPNFNPIGPFPTS